MKRVVSLYWRLPINRLSNSSFCLPLSILPLVLHLVSFAINVVLPMPNCPN